MSEGKIRIRELSGDRERLWGLILRRDGDDCMGRAMELHRQGVPKHVCVTEFGDEGRGPGDDLLCALRTRATSSPGHH